MWIRTLLATLVGALAPVAATPADLAAPTIFIASDSTAATYPASSYPQMGWAMLLACSLDGRVKVVNMARPGRSARSFRAEGALAMIEAQARSGDLLLIQFGHNDATRGFPAAYTPVPAFRDELSAYIDSARQHGMKPLLLTPVSKMEFADRRLFNSLSRYAQAVRDVARDKAVGLIDLNMLSQAALLAMGPDAAKSLYLADAIHLTERGARLAASLVALGLAVEPSISAHMRLAAAPAILRGARCPPA